MGSWKDPFLTVTFPSKVIFIISSWVLFVINLGVIIGDLYHFLVSQRGDLMSFHFTVSLLFSHVTSFYLALIASVYTMQADDGFLTCLSLTSLGMKPGRLIGPTTRGCRNANWVIGGQSLLFSPIRYTGLLWGNHQVSNRYIFLFHPVANFSLYLARFWMDYLTIEYREEKY
ncbi:transmembrane protein 262-like [Thamnophis elegans]|uniref:transmembrane protein 262-like n=1 Tax=Thamnophis elegans TaxID=35005 RepID=UPI001378BED9|nr:transmembrane protein 262-like [Thamnophis elegans]